MYIKQWVPKKLKKRIIALFFVFTLLFSGLLSLGFLSLYKTTERKLQSIDMGLAIERIRKQYLNGENVGRVNRFFHGEKHSSKFPEWVRDLPAGFHKVKRDHLIWHVMIVDYPDQRYILLRDYSVFESTQLHPLLLSLLVLISSLILSVILIWITLYFVINPIIRLEKSVRMELSPERKNQLSHAYDDHEIGHLAQAFDQVYDQLNQALQREKLFTADISHELRTPLMVILSSAELLVTSLELSDKAQQRVIKIEYAAQQILQRLEVYLSLARQHTLTINQFKQQAIIDIAKTVIQENQIFASQYLIQLELKTNHIVKSYPADFCHTILSNLVKNAIEYAGEKSIVTISLYQDGFSVSDDGHGIYPHLQPHIFKAFTGTNSLSSQHLGLGLSLVQRICDYLKWKIEFSSEPQKTTVFRVYIPTDNSQTSELK